MFGVFDYVFGFLFEDKLCYLMGVGKFDDIVGVVVCGVDMMDCVLFLCLGWMGQVWIWCGQVNIKNVCYVDDLCLLDVDCICFVCIGYLCVYLYYVFCLGEMILGMLLIWYNLYYFQELMVGLCVVIVVGSLDVFVVDFEVKWVQGDIDFLQIVIQCFDFWIRLFYVWNCRFGGCFVYV